MIKIDGWAWVPRKKLRPSHLSELKDALTVFVRNTNPYDDESPPPLKLYVENADYIGVPREYYKRAMNRLNPGGSEVLRVSDGEPMHGDVECLVKTDPPYEEQAKAVDAMLRWTESNKYGGMMLRAATGTGKTVMGLTFAYRHGRKTAILVHKEFFLRQWRDRIQSFFPGARIGYVRGPECDYEDKDFVICMLQSIARDDGDKYPPEFYSAFGLIISDECHRIGARTWSGIAPRFTARYALGLTATPRRKDGAEAVFWNLLGRIVYDVKTESMIPGVRRLYSMDPLKPKFKMKKGKRTRINPDTLKHQGVLKDLTTNDDRTDLIAEDIINALRKGRKVMAVSERLKHLEAIELSVYRQLEQGEDFAIDFYVGGRKEHEYVKAESAQLILATVQQISEGLDIAAIDVMVLTTPMSDVEQVVGRVRRYCKPSKSKCEHLCPWRAGECQGKPKPIVLDVVDGNVKQAVYKYAQRVKFYESIGAMKKS